MFCNKRVFQSLSVSERQNHLSSPGTPLDEQIVCEMFFSIKRFMLSILFMTDTKTNFEHDVTKAINVDHPKEVQWTGHV